LASTACCFNVVVEVASQAAVVKTPEALDVTQDALPESLVLRFGRQS
jgi:hypothetical protein